jgi:hypothetical protein
MTPLPKRRRFQLGDRAAPSVNDPMELSRRIADAEVAARRAREEHQPKEISENEHVQGG